MSGLVTQDLEGHEFEKTCNNDKSLSEIQLEHEKKDAFIVAVVKVVHEFDLFRDCMMLVKEIVNRLLEEMDEKKLEWWFEQDIDDDEEEDEEGEGGSEDGENHPSQMKLSFAIPSPNNILKDIIACPIDLNPSRIERQHWTMMRCFRTEMKSWNEMIHYHFHQGYHPTDEMRMDDLEWKKNLSPGCKEMLLMRMKEIEAFNALKNTGDQEEESDRKEITQKEKRARCYVCKMRGHVYWKCPNKKKKDLFKHKGIEKPTYKKAADKIKYPEKVKYPEKAHVITDYMIECTSEATWNEIWKEETKKKFIFSYGIRDAQMKAKEGTFLIPNVYYTPEVTLNILSHDLLEEQGYVVEIRNNKCNIHYMVGRKGKEKEELLLVKGLQDLKWDKDDVQDYVDEEYISWNGSLLDEIPPRVGVMEINLLSLHKIIDNLGGYLCVTLGDKWKTVAGLQGLIEDDREAMRYCYKRFIDMVKVYYKTAERPWYEKKPRNEVGESSSGTNKEKDP
uniref:ARID DNA-binding domain-containing protein n=1 Tax=Tanacetum cinerariifolium TaxID=118510 RepID=A0A6L2LNR6_TANCI|nr:ARID DNA-binding domain-containing protein [Tanacetum cinerariifolium]